MCLIAFAIGTTPAWPLLLAGNRDEFFERPTAPLHRWTDSEAGIWAGRDQRDGGTWLGLNEAGRVALLTNVRSPRPGPGRHSRGELATRWLEGGCSLERFVADLDPQAYGGFNLVVGDLRLGQWTWLCNRTPARPHTDTAVALHRQELTPGVYGLSNAVLDTPWHKTRRLKAAVGQAARQPEDEKLFSQTLAAALADTAPSDELPDTGVPGDWERALSSPFVCAPDRGYGTRSSLVVRVRSEGRQHLADLQEWTHSPAGWSSEAPTLIQLSI